MGRGDTFNFFEYESDDGQTYAVKLSDAVADAGSFTLVSGAFSQVWPYGAKNMRHVIGRDSDGNHTRLPLSQQTNTLYMSGGTFTIRGTEYNVLGRIGEKRKLNSVA